MKTTNHPSVRAEHVRTNEKSHPAGVALENNQITERNSTVQTTCAPVPNAEKSGSVTLTQTKTDSRIDTRLLALHLGVKHRNLFELVTDYKSDFEELGILRFQTGVISGRGQPEKFCLLNEDQAYLLLTYSRNTARVRALKLKLVLAFREARLAAELRQVEYLPAYHALHDAIKTRSHGSPNERFVHMNANKVINQLAGVQPGHRAFSGPLSQSLLAVASALAARAVIDAAEGASLHDNVKAALEPLKAALSLGVDHG